MKHGFFNNEDFVEQLQQRIALVRTSKNYEFKEALIEPFLKQIENTINHAETIPELKENLAANMLAIHNQYIADGNAFIPIFDLLKPTLINQPMGGDLITLEVPESAPEQVDSNPYLELA